ncbi:MAG: hypothetical protein KBS59_01560, partial [Clostridiales bacterium]|nr:hypothetical protein [Clostridiales bacterium]
RPTDEILRDYKSGKTSRYLEQLYFQYGRYLLISSSRKNSYPANLQGTWNRYNTSPWSCGYWHNINVQMNYWPAMSTNIAETFEPYMDYCEAYQALAQRNADDYISRYYPENFSEKSGENGWTIGTGAWLYNISAAPDAKTGHSGPGTGGFTVKLLYEYYAFTKDEKILRRVYPLIESMAKFLLKTLVYENGEWLVKYSASPEQCQDGHYVPTRGCAFDQQMVWETLHDVITLSEILGIENGTVKEAKEKIDRLSPVIVGASGQVKEFREEQNYGDIGEYNHRHISQLVGLYPGTSISPDNEEHINAARFTLTARGDKSTGWSTAHKMNLWARAQNGDRAFALYKMLLSNCTAWNLWDMHPPFQIDGNFGGTAGVSEMLVQSHAGYIHLLPAIPVEWQSGSFSGLVARGNFVLCARWENAKIVSLDVLSRCGGKCRVRDYGIKEILCDGAKISVSLHSGIAEFDTVKGKKYTVISK